MTIEKSLEKIGFSSGEIRVYLALVNIGETTINNIYKNTSIDRRNLYDILTRLENKSLVSIIEDKGKRVFKAANPKKILNYLEEKQEELAVVKEKIEGEIGSLIENYNKKKQNIGVEQFRGRDGFMFIAEDMLNYNDVWIVGGNGKIEEYLPFFWIHYNKKRIKKRVKWHDLIQSGTILDEFKNKSKEALKKELYEYKTLPLGHKSPHTIIIYGNKVVTVLWDEGLFAVSVESEAISKSYKEYFKFLWRHSE